MINDHSNMKMNENKIKIILIIDRRKEKTFAILIALYFS
jgi:hypothetical protein